MLQRLRQSSFWLLSLIGSTITIFMPATAAAQLAPVMGTHYAAQTSDTGFAGAVNSQGGYGATVPLDLSPAKGGLPVPLSIVYGGRHFGAAGLGWDVPLSYIYHSKTIAHHRPKPAPFSVDPTTPINSPDLLILMLLGERIELVRNAANTAWVGRHGSEQLEVRDRGNGTMVAYDGNGLTYNFSAQGGCAECRLDNGNLFLLRSIVAAGGDSVLLVYRFGEPPLPSGGTGLSIDLITVAYNKKPNGNCFKDRIILTYDGASTAPLSMSMLGSTVLARVHKLTGIEVTRAGNSTDPAVCMTFRQSVRKYTFTYQADPDTGQQRLQKVTMVGQQGTPERGVILPVASYSYGRVTSTDGRITYQKTQSITPPPVPPVITFGLSYTSAFPRVGVIPPITRLISPQNLIDLNGDGRPDLMSELGVFKNIPDANGTTAFTPPSGSGLSVFGFEESETTNHAPRFGGNVQPDGKLLNRVDIYKRHIDMNGDGRVDFVDAQTDPTRWILHINAPDPTDPNKSIDIVRTISTAPIRQAIKHRFFRLDDSKPIPLARITSVQDTTLDACWVWQGVQWTLANPITCQNFPPNTKKPEKTITEWELKDINDDGYPDFVYTESTVRYNDFFPQDRPTSPGTVVGQTAIIRTPTDLFGSNNVMALINTIGVHMTNDDAFAFASPVMLANDGCGVARWQAAPGAVSSSELSQTCGFEDINGDGLVDRVTSVHNNIFISTAALGTGDADHPFSTGATITLPGPLARNSTVLVAQPDGIHVPASCVSGQTSYDTQRTAGLHDINGDGIPDYITSVDTTVGRLWRLQLGTGTGFAPQVSVTSPVGLELSLERNTCTNTDVIMPGQGTTRTPIGLYDLDGDGQPEVVSMPATNAMHWDVYQLTSPDPISWIGHTSPSVPSAGRLVAIDNGYGAITRIDYLSAKENGTTRHNVPYPEIVVAAEGTTDSGNYLLSAVITYAYGGAELIFDSAEDRFVFPGYQRTVSKATTDEATVNGDGIATITDAYPLAPFVPTLDAQSRFSRYRRVGRVRDITRLSGFLDNDAWGLLAINIANDSRRIAGAHYFWDARLLPAGAPLPTNERCVDMMYPYDFSLSQANQLSPTISECTKHGFAFQTSVFSYRGTPGTASPFTDATVLTLTEVQSVDDFGRITSVAEFNDLFRSDDNLCTQTVYAEPTGTNERVLNAPASRAVTDCGTQPKTLAHESWEYDGKKPSNTDPKIRVSNGFVTSHIVSRIDLDTFDSLGDIHFFDATYDAVGNPLTVTKTRDDGATQKVTMTYDAFGLAPLSVKTDATNADGTKPLSQQTTFIRDPVTLRSTVATDANGMKLDYKYDGFDRLTQTSVTPLTGPAGVLSTTSYNGFAISSTTARNIVQKVFTDPVAPANLGSAVGRVATAYFNSLGRGTSTEVQLGADYANKKLIVGQRFYDSLGRVHFEADPFPATEGLSIPYGTTYYFDADGTPECSVRGQGLQQRTSVTDEFKEIYPTCFGHTFKNNQEIVSVRDAAALLLTSPQAKVENTSVRTAIGRVIEQSTRRGAVRERTAFSYDLLGHMTSMIRYQDPGEPSGAVTTRWHYDSLGLMNQLEEPDVAPQLRTFDSWGQITQVQWCDDKNPVTCPTSDRRSITRYDALGRLTHSEDRVNNTTIAETVHDFTYDIGVNTTTPPVIATNTIGRLAKVTSPTNAVSFSYDPFGRINASVFTDRTTTTNNIYVEKHDIHADGSEQALHLLLPDTAFKDERVDYAYDSAGRMRSIKYFDGSITKDLFTATGSADIDIFGRIRQATYGVATYTADYADTGRRLIHHFQVNSPSPQTTSRRIAFPATPGTDAATTAFDPVGRERVRRETKDGVPGMIRLNQYNALGQLIASLDFDVIAQTSTTLRSFVYDNIGNVRTQVDPTAGNPSSVRLNYQTIDPDRICSIGYGPNPPAATCDVKHDGAGNMLEEPTHSGSKRVLSYFPSGQVRTATRGDSHATFDYDAFGAVQRLVLTSTSSPDTRNDKHLGSLIYRRDELIGGTRRSVITRSIPGLGGLIATRHGPGVNDPWTFTFGEGRGNRFVTDQTGAFMQDIDYQPYGEATSNGEKPGSQKYANAQWNGGDALQALELVQLGARIYDPVIGRFLSRDPLIIPGTASATNPYAFANNDPVNYSDPTGLQGGETDPTGTPPGCHPGVCSPGGPGNPGGFSKLGRWIKCRFTDCSPPKPEPHTSTTTSGSGATLPGAGNGSSFDKRNPGLRAFYERNPEFGDELEERIAAYEHKRSLPARERALVFSLLELQAYTASVIPGVGQVTRLPGLLKAGYRALGMSSRAAGIFSSATTGALFSAEINVALNAAHGKEITGRGVLFAAGTGMVGGALGKALMGSGGPFAWVAGDHLSNNLGRFLAAQAAFIPLSLGVGMASSAVNGSDINAEMQGQAVNYAGSAGRALLFNVLGAYVPAMGPGEPASQLINGLILGPAQSAIVQALVPEWVPK